MVGTEIQPTLIWKAEFVNYECGYLAEKKCKQVLKTVNFVLTAYSKKRQDKSRDEILRKREPGLEILGNFQLIQQKTLKL